MKGLICTHTQSRLLTAFAIRRILKHFGIDANCMVTDDVHSAGGKSYINSNYDFAIVVEYRRASDTGTTGNNAYSWLSYAAGDKPIFYLGGQVRGSTPTDFPVIAFNSTDTNTFYQTETGQVATDEMRRVGSCIKRPDGSAYLWGKFVNYVWPGTPTEYGYYRVDTAKLDASREVLWVLDDMRMGISTPPVNHAVAVRYYNRYFLPAIGYDPFAYHFFNRLGMGRRFAALGLLLWAMSHAGIRPTRRIPIWCEIDHPLGVGGNSGYTVQQRLFLLRTSTQWLYDYSKSRRIPFVFGISTNHTRDSAWGHYKTLQDYPTEAQPIHDLLVRAVREGLWFACWHDHSFELGAGASSYTRHSGGTYGAPASVPPWGTGSSASITLNYETPLLVHIEDQENWMQQIGFPDAWAGNQKHINFANNSYGGWQVLALMNKHRGLRSCRVLPSTHTVTCSPTGSYRQVGYGLADDVTQVGGVWLVNSEDFHYNADNGLYAGGSDLNTSMSLGATSVQQAYRRFMAWAVDRFLSLTIYELGIAYWHDTACKSASLNDPLGRCWITGSYNGYVELVSEFDNAVRLLADWLKWGTPAEMQQLRNTLRNEVRY